jgi:uncharacterized protein
LGHAIYVSPLRWTIVLSPLAPVFYISARINSISVASARIIAFIAFAALISLSMSAPLVVYTGALIGRAFFATAAAFASLSLCGYTTRRDLSAMGSFMMMGSSASSSRACSTCSCTAPACSSGSRFLRW